VTMTPLEALAHAVKSFDLTYDRVTAGYGATTDLDVDLDVLEDAIRLYRQGQVSQAWLWRLWIREEPA
jgi:hypothetical protein